MARSKIGKKNMLTSEGSEIMGFKGLTHRNEKVNFFSVPGHFCFLSCLSVKGPFVPATESRQGCKSIKLQRKCVPCFLLQCSCYWVCSVSYRTVSAAAVILSGLLPLIP